MVARILACLLYLFSAAAFADDYPSRSIRMIVPFAPGGGTDTVGRLIAQKLTEKWGQQVIVENQPGASGGIGVRVAGRAEPDGYTLLMASTGAMMAANDARDGQSEFDVNEHLAPVALGAATPYIVVAGPKFEASSIADIVRISREKPGSVTYGSSGVGAASHLAGVLLEQQAKIKMLHVPYKGTAPATVDLMGGQIDVMFAPPETVQAFVEAGKLRAIATTGAQRSRFHPNLPTVAEGGVPGYEAVGWFGLLAPAHTPSAIVDKLNKAIVEMMGTKEFQDRLAMLGAEPNKLTPGEFGRMINSDGRKWMHLVIANQIALPTSSLK